MAPRRILIFGVTGSGKTTLAARLAQELSIAHIELDSLFHGPGWTPTPEPEFLEKVRAAADAAPQGWVADGNYSAVRPYLMTLADTAIWIDLPWLTSYGRMLRRTFGRFLRREELWNGNRETLKGMFMEKDSLLLWGIKAHQRTRARVCEALDSAGGHLETHILRSPAEVEALATELTAGGQAERVPWQGREAR